MQPLVSFVAPIYNYYPILIPALISQEYQNWELIIIHDSPNSNMEDLVKSFNESRIKYMSTKERYNDWGHSLRPIGLQNVSQNSDYVIVTNADNYYLPQFLLLMIEPLVQDNDIVATYCNFLNRKQLNNSRLIHGGIDCGNFMVRTYIAKKIGWVGREFAADWRFINSIIEKFGESSIKKIPDDVLFVHN